MLILWEKRIAPEYKIRSLAKSEETNPSLIVQFILSLMGSSYTLLINYQFIPIQKKNQTSNHVILYKPAFFNSLVYVF